MKMSHNFLILISSCNINNFSLIFVNVKIKKNNRRIYLHIFSFSLLSIAISVTEISISSITVYYQNSIFLVGASDE